MAIVLKKSNIWLDHCLQIWKNVIIIYSSSGDFVCGAIEYVSVKIKDWDVVFARGKSSS